MVLTGVILCVCKRRRSSRQAHAESHWPSVEAGVLSGDNDNGGDDSSGLAEAKSIESGGGMNQPAAQTEPCTDELAVNERAMHEEWSNDDRFRVIGNETVGVTSDAPTEGGDHPEPPTTEFLPEFSSGLGSAVGSA